jgi:acetyltransferase
MSEQHYLHPLFNPARVALIGATERDGALGRFVHLNLLAGGFKGEICAVNPKYSRINGEKCYSSLDAVKSAVDLVIIATPAATVPDLIEEAGRCGVRAAIVLSAGFSEVGAEGQALQDRVLQRARQFGIRVLGPNCLGMLRPHIGLNASFARGNALPGNIALLSQSGAVAAALLDFASGLGLGFSAMVSTGAAADLDFGEMLDFYTWDAATRSIVLYIEGIRDARRFISGLRAAARVKPVVALKVGRHSQGSRAAKSHTGSLVGNDVVFDSALRRSGAVRVATYGEMFSVVEALSGGKTPRGGRLVVVSNGGGLGVMAADAASDVGLRLADLSPETSAALDKVLPATWSHGNPVDVIGDAPPRRLAQALQICAAAPECDGVLTLFCPTMTAGSKDTATEIAAVAAQSGKPVLVALLGEADARPGREILASSHVPVFLTPESGVRAFGFMATYFKTQQLLLEAPQARQFPEPDMATAMRVMDEASAAGVTTLSEAQSKTLIAAFGINVSMTRVAADMEEAVVVARSIGYPVVMKVLSRDISHKSDVGGVRLNLGSDEEVRASYTNMMTRIAKALPDATIQGVTLQPMVKKPDGQEVMIGVASDPVFGPVLSFGAGGTAVEVLKDNAVALPPLNVNLARDMMRRTRVYRLLRGYRNRAATDTDALVSMLLCISDMVCALPAIREIDLNPVLVDPDGAICLDARVVIDPARKFEVGYPHLAIHPYPEQLRETIRLRDSSTLTMRPIRPEDTEMEVAFVDNLSGESRYMRFMYPLTTLTPELLARFTQIDYDREMALIATWTEDGKESIAGVCRYITKWDAEACEFAVVVADRWQGRGLATILMNRLTDYARAAGLSLMEGSVLAQNDRMLSLMRNLGFEVHSDPGSAGIMQITKKLR